MNKTRCIARVSVAAGLLAAALGAARFRAAVYDANARGDERPLAARVFSYTDTSDGRTTAAIRFEISGDEESHRLAGIIGAMGPDIEPAPGFEGVRGANRITADEMRQVLRAGASLRTVEGKGRGEARAAAGMLRAARYGTIPVRRLLPDGILDLHAQSRSEYLLEIALETARLEDGDYTTELHVGGAPRLRVAHARHGERAIVYRFESIGNPQEERARVEPAPLVRPSGAHALEVRVPERQEDGPRSPAPDAPADPERLDRKLAFDGWDGLDLEAKWVRYRGITEAHALWRREFIDELGARKDFEVLEWISIAELDSSDAPYAAQVLAQEGAPAWVRCNFWLIGSQESLRQSDPMSRRLLAIDDPALVLAWMEKYPETQLGSGADLYKELLAATTKRGDPSGLLPPLAAEAVLAHLDPPAELRDFGTAKRAEPGATYIHQVERAMHALVIGNIRDKRWLDKLYRLARHSNERIRCAALLTYSHLESAHIPFRELESIARDDMEPPNARRAAFLAYSYHEHPEVGLRLHRTAQLIASPLWSVAVSRLADVGDEFSLQMLARIDAQALDAEFRAGFQADVDRLRSFVQAAQPQRSATERMAQIAWAELNEDPLAEPLKAWLVPFVRERREQFRVNLVFIAGEPPDRLLADRGLGADREAVAARMREFALELLADAPEKKGESGK